MTEKEKKSGPDEGGPFAGLEPPGQEQYLNCIRCGACDSVCPTYRQSLRETHSPRGRLFLARKVLEGKTEFTPNLIGQMYSCLSCEACAEACPVGLHPAELALELRRLDQQLHPARWKNLVFNRLLKNPALMSTGLWPLRLYQLLGFRAAARALNLTGLLPDQVRDLEGMLPPIPGRTGRSIIPESTTNKGEPRGRVVFFLGCAQNLLFARTSAAAVRVLAENGYQVLTPPDVLCCGMPALSYGDWRSLTDLARHNIARIEKLKAETIVTDCATCGATLKAYGHYLEHDPDWAERAKNFSAKVKDICEFLAAIDLKRPRRPVARRVTYHDPCHLGRTQGVRSQPRKILQQIEGLELVEMKEPDRCCGSAGTQIITNYEMSMGVLDRKMDNAAAVEPDFIATGCPSCRMQLTTGCRRRGLSAEVVHPVELLEAAYGDSESGK